MEIWVVTAISCENCNSACVATYDYKPTQKEIDAVVKECGDMFCIRSYAVETVVNDKPIEMEEKNVD